MDDEMERTTGEHLELLREIRNYTRFTTVWAFVTAVGLWVLLFGLVVLKVEVQVL